MLEVVWKKLGGKVEDREVAATIIKQTTVLYVALGVISVALAVMVTPYAYVDAVLLFGLALGLFKLKKRWVAGVMVGYSLMTLAGGLLVKPAVVSVFLLGFVLWMSIRAWQATSFLVSSTK